MNKLAATLLAVGFTTVAIAQQPEPPAPPAPPPPRGLEQQPLPRQERQIAQPSFPSFQVADKNKDGQISRQEASGIQGLDFAAADTNNSSFLDLNEYMVAISKLSATPRG
ncbi:MAG TPA: hypothetical protein VE907_18605 [Gammaproteobacteria bacterium]|nr:hypothetical protein [Gammaproteobacteria bacterium]